MMPQNPHLSPIVCNGPYEKDRPKGAGMSLRPEFYSGRGMWCRDVTEGQLRTIYEGIAAGEARGHFPAGAADAFLQMVWASPVLTGTAFITNLLALDARGYTYLKEPPSTSNLDFGPDDGHREVLGMCSLLSALDHPADPALDQVATITLRNSFLRSINRTDLLQEVPLLCETPDGRLVQYRFNGNDFRCSR